MKIKICEENREKIEKLLEKTSGKATDRVMDFSEVLFSKILFSKRLSKIMKKHAKHFVLRYSLATGMPSSYKYKYSADYIDVSTNGKDFFIVNSSRKDYWPSESKLSYIYLQNEKEGGKIAEEVKDYFLKEFVKI